jgi:hypothetical protein
MDKSIIDISVYLCILLLFLKNLKNSFFKIILLIRINLKLIVSISFFVEHYFESNRFLHYITD